MVETGRASVGRAVIKRLGRREADDDVAAGFWRCQELSPVGSRSFPEAALWSERLTRDSSLNRTRQQAYNPLKQPGIDNGFIDLLGLERWVGSFSIAYG